MKSSPMGRRPIYPRGLEPAASNQRSNPTGPLKILYEFPELPSSWSSNNPWPRGTRAPKTKRVRDWAPPFSLPERRQHLLSCRVQGAALGGGGRHRRPPPPSLRPPPPPARLLSTRGRRKRGEAPALSSFRSGCNLRYFALRVLVGAAAGAQGVGDVWGCFGLAKDLMILFRMGSFGYGLRSAEERGQVHCIFRVLPSIKCCYPIGPSEYQPFDHLPLGGFFSGEGRLYS